MKENYLKRKIFTASIKKPLTILPLTLGAFSLILFFVFNAFTIFFNIFIMGLGISLSSLIYNFFFNREKLTTIYLSSLERQTELEEKRQLRRLKRSLRSTKFDDDVGVYGERGCEQFEQLEQKYKNYLNILNEKFHPSELAYGRYRSVAEHLYVSLVERFKKLSLILEAANAVDLDYVSEMPKELSFEQNNSGLTSIERRKRIKSSQLVKVESILSLNEKSLTMLDKTASALAMVTTNEGASGKNIEIVLKQLEQLAYSAEKYNIDKE